MTEPTMNQYAPPLAAVADVAPSTAPAELKLFSHKGRIGRLRYLAYGSGASILYYMLIGGLTASVRDSNTLAVAVFAAFGAVLWFTVITGIKRCHDMEISGWWSLTLIIPVIVLAWMFWPGSRGENRFGPPPPPNTMGVRLLGFIVPVLIVGILAAVAIPQYKHYTDRARAAQSAAPQ